MKALHLFNTLNKALFTLSLLIYSFVARAGKDLDLPDVDIDIDKKEWYEQWWVWVLAAAVFIIIIVAITNRGKRS